MAELFQTCKQNIAEHLKAIFAVGELQPEPALNQWLITAVGGKSNRLVLRPSHPTLRANTAFAR